MPSQRGGHHRPGRHSGHRLHLGWRWAFIFRWPALLWLCFWIPLYETPSGTNGHQRRELAHIGSDADDASAVPAHGMAAGSAPSSDLVVHRGQVHDRSIWWFFLIWLPDYFNTTRG